LTRIAANRGTTIKAIIQLAATMGRAIKEGLEYYPTYVDFEENDKVSMMLAECGMLGEIVLQRLWRSIYRNKGYYYAFGPDECLLMSRRIGYGLKAPDIMEVVQICLKRNLFDLRLYETYGILTSKRIQEVYVMATIERIQVRIDQRYLLISLPKRGNISVYNPDLSTGKQPKNAISPPVIEREIEFPGRISNDKSDKSIDKYTKESKVKESEEKESEEGAPPVTLFSKDYFKIPIEKRKEAFWGAVISYNNTYDEACLQKFYKIWSELNPSGKRMRFELQSTWELEGRLNTWADGWKAIEEKNAKNAKDSPTRSRMHNNMDVATEVLQDLMKHG